jgi:hypothetical protein
VSFDLFAQAFDESLDIPRSEILASLRPFLAEEADEGFCRTRTADGGEADFYVRDGGFMVNHFAPGETVQLIYETASSFGLALLGPELPAMLTDPRQLAYLPDGLASAKPPPVLVASGNDIQSLIESDDEAYRRCRWRLEATPGT